VFVVNELGRRFHSPRMAGDINDVGPFGLLMLAYMAFYLGLGRMLIVWLRRISEFGLTAVLLIHVMVLSAAAMLPTFLQFWVQNFRDADYSGLQTMNWLWSLMEAVNGNWTMWPVVFTAGLAGLCMFALQLVLAAREVEATRMDTPLRVQQDDYHTHGLAVPMGPMSPTDNETGREPPE
jgi:hypothetical protein